MIETIEIRNFKSIGKIKLDLGRINVFIGENGAGKSNLLEAIALAGAAAAGKLDNEFLTSRGIRVTQPQHMRPRFEGCADNAPIRVNLSDSAQKNFQYEMQHDNKQYSSWSYKFTKDGLDEMQFVQAEIKKFVSSSPENQRKFDEGTAAFLDNIKTSFNKPIKGRKSTSADFISNLFRKFQEEHSSHPKEIEDFVIFSPENSKLRSIETESQIEPLGINGEGLIKFLAYLFITNPEIITNINSCLKLLGWFEEFSVNLESNAPSIDIYDKYLDDSKKTLVLQSANEGFLFLIFYFSLFSNSYTPSFFAIDNIDASLNPKMCIALIQQLSSLANINHKQAILTTHNPAILDGLNLDDNNQRLFVISRNLDGYTRIKRILKPQGKNLKLSDMFMSGSLGGLPQGF